MFYGLRFRRNYPVHVRGGQVFFLDFYSPERKIAIELDGPEHRAWKDQERDEKVKKSLGCQIIRIKNRSVKRDIDSAMGLIISQLIDEEIIPDEIKTQDAHLRQVALYG